MELDKIAGLAMPKAAPANRAKPDAANVQSGTLPEFTTLMEGEIGEADLATNNRPAPELPQGVVARVTLEKPIMETEPEEALQPNITAKPPLDKQPETKDVLAAIAPAMPARPLQDKAAQTDFSAPIAAPRAKATPETTFSAPEMAKQAPSAVEVPKKTTRAEGQTKQDIAPPQLPTLKETQPIKTAPATAPTTPITLEPQAPAAQARKEAQAEPEPLRTDTTVKPTTQALEAKPKAEIQLQTLPSPLTSFSNSEMATDTPAELQFNIRIDRQSADISHISRPATQAPPVASQITAQLPQALTKTDKQTIELRLDPPELGRVTIHLTTNDQQVTAQVVADRADTVDLMRRHAEVLAATLARAGFSQANLSFQQGQSQNKEQTFEQFQGITGVFESEAPDIPAQTLTGLDGRLDIRL